MAKGRPDHGWAGLGWAAAWEVLIPELGESVTDIV